MVGVKKSTRCSLKDATVAVGTKRGKLSSIPDKSFNPVNKGWCIIGDFNEVLSHDEKVGGRCRVESQIALFCEVLQHGNLIDLGWKGCKFTWSNRHEDLSFTKERLDRALANKLWRDNFPEVQVNTMSSMCSHHRPILLECCHRHRHVSRFHFPFKYEVSWSKEDGCRDVITSAWQRGEDLLSQSGSLQRKLELCSKELKHWSRTFNRDRQIAIKQKA